MTSGNEYYHATRHPLPCLLFVVPLVITYELGVIYLGGTRCDEIRNGVDYWLRQMFCGTGFIQQIVAPTTLILGLLVWAYVRKNDRPKNLFEALSGIGLESIGFALGLWMLSRSMAPVLDSFGLTFSPETRKSLALVVTYLGAGIYEEAIFRLLLFSGLLWFFRKAEVPLFLSMLIAAMASATLFASAHHFGEAGEDFEPYVFLFRTAAGIYFAVIYHFRGFGIAVGAHACYDVVIGVTTAAIQVG